MSFVSKREFKNYKANVMKQIAIALIVVLLAACDKEEDKIDPNVSKVEGVYTGTLRDTPGSPIVEIQVKAGTGNDVVLTFVHNSETGKVELIGTELAFTNFSGDDYLQFNIGDQSSREKVKYNYSGRRSIWYDQLPSRQGTFIISPGGKVRLLLAAEVTMPDDKKFQMIMDVNRK